jgi:predicted PolB exonuclease-like 3'-5' exonuclease
MAGVLVFDIETVPDADLVSEMPRAESSPAFVGSGVSDAPQIPKIPFNRVVMIGAATLSVETGFGGEVYRLTEMQLLSGPERDVLEGFWSLAQGMRLVTFNGRAFDLPVLESRSLRHGLALPWYFADGSVRGDASLHLDLLHFLSNGEPKNRARLHDYCKLVGLPGKMGFDGACVADLVRDQRFEELSAYCATDVLQTLGLFLRVQRLRGACQPMAYPAMLRAVRDSIARLTETRTGLERETLSGFLLQSEPFWMKGAAGPTEELRAF